MHLKEIISNKIYTSSLHNLPESSGIINTLNAHSYCLAKSDPEFHRALMQSDVLLPDGISIIMAARVLNEGRIKKIAGTDVHDYLLSRSNERCHKVFYLGASKKTLHLIQKRIKIEFPNILIKTYSPPYKPEFDSMDTKKMIKKINDFAPDVLFIGITAPKQEKWLHMNKDKIKVPTITCIGAVFDFYAGTISRSPKWMINAGLEWLFRLVKEPKRMWKRYLINNTNFLAYVFREKCLSCFECKQVNPHKKS